MNDYPTKAQAIANLKRYLRQLSYFDDSILPPPLTDTWDARTEAALVAFQKNNGLPETGRADEVTWNLLYAEYKRSIDKASLPNAMPIFHSGPHGYEIGMGEQSFAVTAIQYMLGEITLHYDNLGDVPQSGIYNEETAKAIREFQMRNLLPVTGTVDKTTWDFLVASYKIGFQNVKQ